MAERLHEAQMVKAGTLTHTYHLIISIFVLVYCSGHCYTKVATWQKQLYEVYVSKAALKYNAVVIRRSSISHTTERLYGVQVVQATHLLISIILCTCNYVYCYCKAKV